MCLPANNDTLHIKLNFILVYMLILQINSSMDPLSGGPCQGIRTSSKALERLGIYQEVVCFDDLNATFLGIDPFPVHALGRGLSSWHYNIRLISWLRKNIHRFDIVITNGLWIYHTIAVYQIIRKLRKSNNLKISTQYSTPKWFVMPHGMLDPYFQRASNRKLKAIRNWFYWKLLEHKVISAANGLLFTSETELLLARENFRPYNPKREINIGYGIEAPPKYSLSMKEAFLDKCPIMAQDPYLLFLGRIHSKKGVDLLIKAYVYAVEQLYFTGKVTPKLVIAGPGIDTEYGKLILKIVHGLPSIGANIYFPGMLTGDSKWGAYYGCEAFILPSHQENFGIAVVEALGCSKPVLISNQVNIWREIEQEGGGLIAEDNLIGTQSLLQKWTAITPAKKRGMSEKAKLTFERHFSIELAARQFKEGIAMT